MNTKEQRNQPASCGGPRLLQILMYDLTRPHIAQGDWPLKENGSIPRASLEGMILECFKLAKQHVLASLVFLESTALVAALPCKS